MKKFIIFFLIFGLQLAFAEKNTPNILKITGEVEKEYKFTLNDIKNLDTTNCRSTEVNEKGEYLGSYEYKGVLLRHILDKIKVIKSENAPFDRELDMVITVKDKNGNLSQFSYGELTMRKDIFPVLIAFERTPIMPGKSKTYSKNLKNGIKDQLLLVCPEDEKNSRYLESISEINIHSIKTPDNILPKMQRRLKCEASCVTLVDNEHTKTINFKNISEIGINNWVRVGHGKGYKNIKNVKGLPLIEVLGNNTDLSKGKFYVLCVGCDGYRSLFSYDELFNTKSAKNILILLEKNENHIRGNFSLAVTEDFFVDRCVWGLSHITLIKYQFTSNSFEN